MADIRRIAAIQLEGRVADLEYNLRHVEDLVRQAVRHRPDIVALPEFFTTPITYDARLWRCALPPDNPALDLLVGVARAHRVLIGGSYLEFRAGDVFNTYALVEPDGTVHRHDKDLPTMVENAYYRGGNDDGVFATASGRVGSAVCWELIRTQTVVRMKGRVDLVMAGSHWWSPPRPPAPLAHVWDRMQRQNELYMLETPSTCARLLGVPLVHAAHVGTLTGGFSLLPGGALRLPGPSVLMGETQIVDGMGRIVARRRRDEGPGVVSAEVDLERCATPVALPDRFWIPNLRPVFRAFWYHQNWASRAEYQWARDEGRLVPAHVAYEPAADLVASGGASDVPDAAVTRHDA